MREKISLVVFATLLTSSMAAMILERQGPRGRARRNAFDSIPRAATLGSAASIPSVDLATTPTSTPEAAVLPLFAETPTPSLVETVILIPPSGTVGGSILITSVPIPPSTQPFNVNTPTPDISQAASLAEMPTPSLVETVILIPPSGTVGGSILITSVPILPSTQPFNFNTPIASLPSVITASPAQQSLSFLPPGPFLSFNTLAPSIFPNSGAPTSFPSMLPFTTSTMLPASPTSSSTTILTSTTTSASSSSSSITPASQDTISASVAHSTSAPVSSQRKQLSNGALLGISISLVAFAVIFGALALVYLRRPKKQASPPEDEVYPAVAYLYDPPMNATSGANPLTLQPVAENGSFGYGAAAVGAGGRPGSPETQNAERQALLGEPAAAAAGGAFAGGLRGQRRGYMPAPMSEINESGQEADLGDRRNPFADQPSTEYDSGQYAIAEDRMSTQ